MHMVDACPRPTAPRQWQRRASVREKQPSWHTACAFSSPEPTREYWRQRFVLVVDRDKSHTKVCRAAFREKNSAPRFVLRLGSERDPPFVGARRRRGGMAPAREGAEGAPIARRREGRDDRSSRDDVDFFTPRAALVLGVCRGRAVLGEAVELRAREGGGVRGEGGGPGVLRAEARRDRGTAAHARESPRDGEGGAPAAPRVPAAPFPDEADAESVDDDENPNARRAARASSNDSSNDSSEGPTTSLPTPGSLVALPEVPEAVGGAWRSLGRVRALGDGDPPDVTKDDASIRDAAERRAFKKEIVVLVANSRGRHLAANAIANLRSVGIEHYLLVTNTKEACEGMRRTRGSKSASGEAASWRVECAWTSFLLGHPRLATYGLTQGEERSDPFRLWWARFHLLERLVAFGYNPMYVDTDVSFRVNPYPLLKGPFARFALVGQDETGHVNGVNIGFVYAQNARAGGPAHRVLNETVARMFAILEHAPGPVTQWDGDVARGAKEHLWDQHIYNDVVESAVFSRDLRRRSGARLIDPSGNERQAWNDAEVNAFPRDTDWESFEVVVRPTDVPLTKAGTKMALEPGRFQARGARLRCVGADVPGYATREEEAKIRALRASNVTLNATSSSNAPTPTIKKRVPRSCVEPELFLASPAWFLAGWSGVAGDERFRGVRGGWNLDPPIVAVAHAVGALAKQQTFKQLGWWQYGAEAFQRGAGEVPAFAAVQSRLDRKGGLGATRLRGDGGDDGGPGHGARRRRRGDRAAGHPGRRAGEAARDPRDRVRLAVDRQRAGRVPRDQGPRARRRRRALRRAGTARCAPGGEERRRDYDGIRGTSRP